MSIELGKRGEDVALDYLLGKGYKLIVRNFKNKLGEIDLVMRHGSTVVGVEVKAKRVGGIDPSEMLTRRKIDKVRMVLMSFSWDCQEKRVECVTVVFGRSDEVLAVEHYDEIS